MQVNHNIEAIAPSKSVTLMSKTKRMQKEDPSIINLTGGDPDFPTPKRICDEAAKYMFAGYTHYTEGQGNPDLRERIARKLQEENQCPYTADEIIVTPGGKFAVYLAVRTLINDGDEAIWLAPGWVSYPSIVQAAGGVPRMVHLNYDDDYRIHRQALEEAVSERTRLLILNYPNNPTGKVLSGEDLEELYAFLTAHPDIYVISDEMYEKIIFDDYRVKSIASYPEFFERTITINGFSKSSAMTGWRIGYLACSRQLCKMMMKLFQHTMSCTSGFLQKGALVALDLPEETEKMRAAYEKRRNLLSDAMAEIPGVTFRAPEGAFYAWVRFDDVKEDSQEICDRLLEEAKIAGVPGNAYGEEDGTFVRFSFASSEEVLQESMKRLKRFMENY